MSGLFQAVENVIADSTGERAVVISGRSVGGGCINNAQAIQLDDGRSFFLKFNSDAGRLFECESEGLSMLAQASSIRVPEVIGTGTADNVSFLVLENIETGRPAGGFMRRLGRGLAALHESSLEVARFGLDSDNFIGATLQPNSWTESWVEFWAEHRLGFQLRLAHDSGLGNSGMYRMGDRLMARLDEYLPGAPEVSLIHGDLWSGNYLCDESGNPALIDPAIYFADAEAEFGMISLFGGVSSEFFDAYYEVRPRREEQDIRIAIYRLYHLLNHLNLFGGSYLSGCLDLLKRLT
ncbi:MAG: fructosamine kinase family protein [Planctomycetota bacterium]